MESNNFQFSQEEQPLLGPFHCLGGGLPPCQVTRDLQSSGVHAQVMMIVFVLFMWSTRSLTLHSSNQEVGVTEDKSAGLIHQFQVRRRIET